MEANPSFFSISSNDKAEDNKFSIEDKKNNIVDSTNSNADTLYGSKNPNEEANDFISKKEAVNFGEANPYFFGSNLNINNQKNFGINNLFPPNQNNNFFQKKEAIGIKPKKNYSYDQKTLISFFKSQTLTRELQKYISQAPEEEKQNIINQLKGTFRNIIKDKNGNYFVSDLIKVCNQDQRIMILSELSQTISEDSTNKYSFHVLQLIIEFSSSPIEYELIIKSFLDYNKLLIACLDSNGSYVVQKIITHIPEKYRMEFNQLFLSIFTFVSKKKYGVCSSKKFISHTKDEDTKSKFISNIEAEFWDLATNEFGNYLIQYTLEKLWYDEKFQSIKKLIEDNFEDLKKEKYSYFICTLFEKLSNQKKFYKSDNTNMNNSTNNNYASVHQLPMSLHNNIMNYKFE